MEDLTRKLYIGIVESVQDPNRKGRIKVRVQSLYDDLDLNDIPYAAPYKDLDGKEFRLPQVGKLVNVLYPNNDLYDPHYIFSENYNINLQNKLKNYSDDEYAKFVALLFDDRTQIFSDDENLTLDYKYNRMTIDNKSINLELKDSQQRLDIGTVGSNQPGFMTLHWFQWFDQVVQTLLVPNTLTGNLGAPIIRPDLDALLQQYQQLKQTFLSNNIFLVDNDKINKLG